MRTKRSREKRWEPTEETIKTVEKLSAVGLTQERIAEYLGISRVTLQMALGRSPALRQAISSGAAKAIAKVGEAAFEMAISKKYPAMTIFFLKTRARWSERTIIEHHTPNTNPQTQKDMVDAVNSFKEILKDLSPKNRRTDLQLGPGLIAEQDNAIEVLAREIEGT